MFPDEEGLFWALLQPNRVIGAGGWDYCRTGTQERRLSILLLPATGELLEESQVEASKLRQKAEDLVKDNKMLIGSPSLEDLVETGGRRWRNNLMARNPELGGRERLCKRLE